MLIQYGADEFECSPALAIVACRILHFCDYWNIPFVVYYATDSEISLITDSKPGNNQNEWNDQLKWKFHFEFTRDYSDLKLTKFPLCEIKPNGIKITVNPIMDITKFSKE